MTGVLEWEDSQGRRGGGVTPYVNDHLECMELMFRGLPILLDLTGFARDLRDVGISSPSCHGFLHVSLSFGILLQCTAFAGCEEDPFCLNKQSSTMKR